MAEKLCYPDTCRGPRIRVGYVSDTDTRGIRAGCVPATYRRLPERIGLKLPLRYVSEGGIRPISSHPVNSPSPRCPTEYNAPPLCLSARTRATQQGEVGRPPATSPPATSHRRRDAAPREAPPPGEAATSSRTGGRRPSPQREGSWRPAPICKVRTPVRPFLLDLLFLLLDSHFPFLISRFHDFIQ